MKKLSKTFKLRVLKKVLLSLSNPYKYNFDGTYNYEGICDILMCENSDIKYEDQRILDKLVDDDDKYEPPKLIGIYPPRNYKPKQYGLWWPLNKKGNNCRIKAVKRAIKRIQNDKR